MATAVHDAAMMDIDYRSALRLTEPYFYEIEASRREAAAPRWQEAESGVMCMCRRGVESGESERQESRASGPARCDRVRAGLSEGLRARTY
jgi:hypothetical protein